MLMLNCQTFNTPELELWNMVRQEPCTYVIKCLVSLNLVCNFVMRRLAFSVQSLETILSSHRAWLMKAINTY